MDENSGNPSGTENQQRGLLNIGPPGGTQPVTPFHNHPLPYPPMPQPQTFFPPPTQHHHPPPPPTYFFHPSPKFSPHPPLPPQPHPGHPAFFNNSPQQMFHLSNNSHPHSHNPYPPFGYHNTSPNIPPPGPFGYNTQLLTAFGYVNPNFGYHNPAMGSHNHLPPPPTAFPPPLPPSSLTSPSSTPSSSRSSVTSFANLTTQTANFFPPTVPSCSSLPRHASKKSDEFVPDNPFKTPSSCPPGIRAPNRPLPGFNTPIKTPASYRKTPTHSPDSVTPIAPSGVHPLATSSTPLHNVSNQATVSPLKASFEKLETRSTPSSSPSTPRSSSSFPNSSSKDNTPISLKISENSISPPNTNDLSPNIPKNTVEESLLVSDADRNSFSISPSTVHTTPNIDSKRKRTQSVQHVPSKSHIRRSLPGTPFVSSFDEPSSKRVKNLSKKYYPPLNLPNESVNNYPIDFVNPSPSAGRDPTRPGFYTLRDTNVEMREASHGTHIVVQKRIVLATPNSCISSLPSKSQSLTSSSASINLSFTPSKGNKEFTPGEATGGSSRTVASFLSKPSSAISSSDVSSAITVAMMAGSASPATSASFQSRAKKSSKGNTSQSRFSSASSATSQNVSSPPSEGNQNYTATRTPSSSSRTRVPSSPTSRSSLFTPIICSANVSSSKGETVYGAERSSNASPALNAIFSHPRAAQSSRRFSSASGTNLSSEDTGSQSQIEYIEKEVEHEKSKETRFSDDTRNAISFDARHFTVSSEATFSKSNPCQIPYKVTNVSVNAPNIPMDFDNLTSPGVFNPTAGTPFFGPRDQTLEELGYETGPIRGNTRSTGPKSTANVGEIINPELGLAFYEQFRWIDRTVEMCGPEEYKATLLSMGASHLFVPPFLSTAMPREIRDRVGWAVRPYNCDPNDSVLVVAKSKAFNSTIPVNPRKQINPVSRCLVCQGIVASTVNIVMFAFLMRKDDTIGQRAIYGSGNNLACYMHFTAASAINTGLNIHKRPGETGNFWSRVVASGYKPPYSL